MDLTPTIVPKSDQLGESEIWLPVVGYEGLYEVSNRGRVRSLPRRDAQGGQRRMRMHRPSRMDAYGHLGVKLRKDGEVRSRYVHQLVLEAFVGARPEGTIACHWNDVSDDNRVENLRWATPRDNRNDMIRNGHDINLAKTECKWGHPLTEDNVRTHAGHRQCRTCQRRNEANYRNRLRANSSKERA